MSSKSLNLKIVIVGASDCGIAFIDYLSSRLINYHHYSLTLFYSFLKSFKLKFYLKIELIQFIVNVLINF